MTRKSASRARARRNTQHKVRLAVETLEDRCLLSGTWTPLTNLLPDPGANTMMLLSDGSVMVEGGAGSTSKNWFKLTPDATGSYINGTFSPLAPMGLERLFFPSNVLPNGKVSVMGGEFTGTPARLTTTNTGELYDPVANSWTPLPTFPGGSFGDVPTVLLPSGKILAGSFLSANTFLFDPATNTWSFAATKLRSDVSREETWTLLPDGSVLSYDNFASVDTGVNTAQRYIPSTNTWVDAGIVPVPLTNFDVGHEIGPALLLPDGRLFQIGAEGHTALYNPSTNTWTAGPSLPGGNGADDAPGSMLPNGHVIFTAHNPDGDAPTHILDFDPVANTITDVTPSGPLGAILASNPAFVDHMLVLPNGDVLLSDYDQQIWEFTPEGAPSDAWRPTIASVVPNGGGTFTVTGTQLNGLSEGASYGDDAEMSTNFPIVQLTNDATGQVFYARTFNWTPAVATGAAPVTAQFTVPAGLPQAIDSLHVVANGIASAPVLFDTLQGLHVFTTTPANGSVVSTRPTSFVVNFNEAIVPATLQAADLTVNGRAANGVTLDATSQIATFTFTTSPVTAQGVQTMAIAANSIVGVDNTGILPFSASFRYDAVTLAVKSTTPATGGILTLPATLFTYDVTFNEAIDPATAGVGNLTLSQGTVTSAVVLPGNTRVRYTIAGLTAEGTLTISIPAGQVKDQFDNPGFAAFSASYQVDVGTAPVPTPLTPESPRGSLIYDSALTGLINFARDTDTFTVNLDAGQNLLEGPSPDQFGIFSDLGSGTSFRTQIVTPGTDPVTTTLNADGVNALIAGEGSQFAIGGSLTTIDGTDSQLLFSLSGSPDDQRQLTLTLAQTADWYKFTLPSHATAVQLDTSTFADGPGEFANTLDPHIELYDGGDNLIATGSALGDGRNETIRATGLTPGATYYVRVTTENNTTGEYVLGVTPLRTPTVTSTVDDAPPDAPASPDGEFEVPHAAEKGWTHVVSPAGFQGDYTIHAQNASPQKSNFAEWEIRATSANPELFATWVALPGNATNATYQVFRDSSEGKSDKGPLLTVVVDQTRGPSDALLFGTTLAQSLGSVNIPKWQPGTMISVRLLTQGANGDVVADGMFDPPAGTVTRTDSVPQAHLQSDERGATVAPPSVLAASAFMFLNETGTERREAALDLTLLTALTGGLGATTPIALMDSRIVQPTLEKSTPGTLLSRGPGVSPPSFQVLRTAPALRDDFWAAVFAD
jgi:hypothetical protein